MHDAAVSNDAVNNAGRMNFICIRVEHPVDGRSEMFRDHEFGRRLVLQMILRRNVKAAYNEQKNNQQACNCSHIICGICGQIKHLSIRIAALIYQMCWTKQDGNKESFMIEIVRATV
jgi:hypothetical protein